MAEADWDWDEAYVEAERLIKEQEIAERRKRREEDERKQRWAAEDWYEDKPAASNKLKQAILKHLVSAEGRDGPTVEQLSSILDYDKWYVWICLKKLKESGGVKRTEDGRIYHYKVWRTLHPERRGAVKHIGTVPRAVLDHKQATPARKVVAAALSIHFYQTRTARTKQKAISFSELATAAAVAEKTARRAVEWLVAEDLLGIVEHGKGRRGHLYRWTPKTKDYKPRLRTRSVVISGSTSNP